MMRAMLVLALLMSAANVQAGEAWSKLWRNADQRGETLLQQGDAKTAAEVFSDPHRKAYAKMKAGDYAGAADELSKLHDHDADYNRGNALAHAGDLQGALGAYNEALKIDPNNQDAQHNKELVEKALKQQPPQQQKSDEKDAQKDKQDGKQEQSQDSTQQGHGKKDEQGHDENKQGDKDKNGKQAQADKPDEKSGKGQDTDPGNKQQGKQENNSRQEKQPQQAAAKDDAEQARRDAEASMSKPASAEKNDVEKAGATGKETMAAALPKTEQQIAKEQWLRNIPDDPGGLLRRKFMIEHMMRQKKAQQ